MDPHLTDQKTQACRSDGICPGSHSREETDLGFEPGLGGGGEFLDLGLALAPDGNPKFKAQFLQEAFSATATRPPGRAPLGCPRSSCSHDKPRQITSLSAAPPWGRCRCLSRLPRPREQARHPPHTCAALARSRCTVKSCGLAICPPRLRRLWEDMVGDPGKASLGKPPRKF